jgi:transaldolase
MTKIFYDGCNIDTYGSFPNVVGFTTNTSIMRQSKQLCYETFYETYKDVIAGRPISFQVFSDDPLVVLEQARSIHSIGPNVYAKIPVISSTGSSFLHVISTLIQEGIKVNITSVFTIDQIKSIYDTLYSLSRTDVPVIVSVFGGRISDTGIIPKTMIQFAVHLYSNLKFVEVLWAGVRDNLVIQQADEIGCHIVTLPDAIISKIQRLGMSLDDLGKDMVATFLKDGQDGKLYIKKK